MLGASGSHSSHIYLDWVTKTKNSSILLCQHFLKYLLDVKRCLQLYTKCKDIVQQAYGQRTVLRLRIESFGVDDLLSFDTVIIILLCTVNVFTICSAVLTSDISNLSINVPRDLSYNNGGVCHRISCTRMSLFVRRKRVCKLRAARKSVCKVCKQRVRVKLNRRCGILLNI